MPDYEIGPFVSVRGVQRAAWPLPSFRSLSARAIRSRADRIVRRICHTEYQLSVMAGTLSPMDTH